MSWRPRYITGIALLMEGGLVLVAIVVGWLVGHEPLRTVLPLDDDWNRHATAIGWGIAATGPMLLGLFVIERSRSGPLFRLQRFVRRLIVPMFEGVSVVAVALNELVAGIGEEMLFRGLLQDGLSLWIGPPHGLWIGLAVASILFGLCHCLTRTYLVLATGIGIYLGWLLLATDSLLAPITAHAVYDFAALVYLVKWQRAGKGGDLIDE